MAMLDVEMSEKWRNCVHRFDEVESQDERSMVCYRCGCPGELNQDTNDVDWPTT